MFLVSDEYKKYIFYLQEKELQELYRKQRLESERESTESANWIVTWLPFVGFLCIVNDGLGNWNIEIIHWNWSTLKFDKYTSLHPKSMFWIWCKHLQLENNTDTGEGGI